MNNSVVQKRYNGEIVTNSTENDCDELLKTIKYNPKDLKGLKKILPKANYEDEEGEKKLNIEEMRGGINSCKNSRKTSETEVVNDQKLKDFLEKRRIIEEK